MIASRIYGPRYWRCSSPYAFVMSNNLRMVAPLSATGFPCPRKEQQMSMFTAEQFRRKAAEDAESIKNTDVPSEIRKFEQSIESLGQLARNEVWLADNFDKMIRSQDALSEGEVAKKPLDSKA